MQTIRTLLSLALVAAVAPACKTDPAVTTSAPTTPSAPPAASGPAPVADAEDIGAPRYAVCRGQGGNPNQLAPSFLDQMDSCESIDTAPADTLSSIAGDGAIIAGKGDCQFEHGITCHFHTSMEFITPDKLKDDEHGIGEMHCIVPSTNANSPTVYGAHVRCKRGTTAAAGTAVCSRALLQVVDHDHCHDGWKCCDNGTLTKPVGKQAPAELKLRPDFRICRDASIEVDCGLFHEMHGHTANVVGLGEEFVGKFNAEHEHDKSH